MNQELSWFEKIKKNFSFDALAQKFDLSRTRFIEMAVFLAVGFLCGILWKKYSNYIIASFVFAGFLIILVHLELLDISINWQVIHQLTGISAQIDAPGAFWIWAKTHLLSVISFFIGVLIGCKVSE